MEIVSVQRKNYLWLLFSFIKVYTERISWRAIASVAGDSWRSRSKDYRAMARAAVSYRLRLNFQLQNLNFTKFHKKSGVIQVKLLGTIDLILNQWE